VVRSPDWNVVPPHKVFNSYYSAFAGQSRRTLRPHCCA
jgi:hypothetical protein